jgi:hypothetical protein
MSQDFTPLIKWQKWIDPFGMENEDAKWVDYDNTIIDINKIKNQYVSNINNDFYDDDEDEEDSLDKNIKSDDNKPVKVIASPMGLIPYNEHTASSKIFNFWVGHTNFSITKDIVDIMENTDGVEILDIFTRYRFRVAIGKCFNDSETMNNISNNITVFLNSNDK